MSDENPTPLAPPQTAPPKVAGEVPPVVGYLLAIRSTILAIVTQVDAALSAALAGGAATSPETCSHPESEPVAGLALTEKPRRRCTACGVEWEVEPTW